MTNQETARIEFFLPKTFGTCQSLTDTQIMKFVIEMQGFSDNENTFIPKEIALVSLDEARSTAHWIVRPSVSHYGLTHATRVKNDWVTHNHHGLSWFRGTSDLKLVVNELQKLTRGADVVYTRGERKWDYLINILDAPVLNLSVDLRNPSFEKMSPIAEKCSYHAKNQNFRCALNCALKIRHWILEGEQKMCDAVSGGACEI